MLLPDIRMVEPLAAAFSATALFVIVERSMLTVVLAASARTALEPLLRMVDLVTLAKTLLFWSLKPSDDERVIVTFFSEATLKPPSLPRFTPIVLWLITVSETNKN